MSPMMRNGRVMIRRVDQTQRAIANGLRSLGIKVWEIEEPCDLLVYYWSNQRQRFCFQTLECKTPTKTGKQGKRKDQAKQEQFLADTGTPVVLSLDAAVDWLASA